MNTQMQAAFYNARRKRAKQRIGNPPIALGNFKPHNYTQTSGYSYDASATFTGGAVVSFVLVGVLPDGLIFNTGSGLITGTPTTVETAENIRITGTNADGSSTTNKASIEIT